MKLIKILSDKIQIKSDRFEFQDIRINSLIAVSDGDVELVTVVTSLMETDTGDSIGGEDFIFENDGIKVIECSIIGSIQNGIFRKAIDQYPTTDIQSREISSEEFHKMLSKYENSGFYIGSYVQHNCPAFVDGNKFFQRHSCIVGNTGSGKSETVAKILEESAKLPGTNIIVFEESSSVVMSALRKCYYKICPDGKENRPVYFDFKNLLGEMVRLNGEEKPTGEVYKAGDKAGLAKTVKGDFNGKLTGVINTMQDKSLDKRYTFLFGDHKQKYLFKVVEQIMKNDKPVKNIDLSDIPHDVAIPVIGVITKLVYDIQRTFESDKVCPVVLVCDEAHVYIPNNFQLSASEKRMVEIFEDIAKEGRKFGITLFPASQRPSELNKTIMAQCANFIVSKLNNENDKTMVKGMLPDGNESIIDSTTTFSPGEVLIIGDAVPIPLKIQVELANERPQSRTIDFWDRWSANPTVDLRQGIEAYMDL